jgi:hypothetical protein
MARFVEGLGRRIRVDGPVPDPASAPGFPVRAELGGPRELEAVARFFEGRGYVVHREGHRLRAVKHRLAALATLAFHASFVLVAVGAAWSTVTRFEGQVDLGEGEEFTGDLRQYVAPPKVPRFATPPRTRFIVEAIEQEVQGFFPIRLIVHLRGEDRLLHDLEINAPYEAGGASFVFKNLGVAPLLVVRDPSGEERFAGLLRLDILNGKPDAFSLEGQQFRAELFPDYVRDGETEATRSREMRDPVLRLTVTHPSGRSKTQSLRPGEEMTFGPYRIEFADWRYWVRLYVRAERGLPLVWAGFLVAACALGWRFLRYRREFVAEAATGPGGPMLRVAGRAEFYRALFADEAAALLRDLEREVGATSSTG